MTSSEHVSNGRERLDLTEALTVFVSTVGSPTFETCLHNLRQQDCDFSLEVIRDVAPMNNALQRMLDECTTPYYVQVDEDMLLFPHAVRTLYERISATPSNVAMYVCTLYDVHVERVIYGLKVYRHDIVRRYPYRDVTGCEWDQVARFRADGYTDIRASIEGATRDSEDTLGLHGTFWTPETIYLRFRVLEIKRRRGNRTHDWVVEAGQMLLRRFLEEGSVSDYYALMGILGGFPPSGSAEGREKDFRTYQGTPGLLSARRFLEEVADIESPPGR
ncbi:MAG: hypothetical protein HKO65_17765 [Gemmatimonadetes bacterium]|nr:hypothetical protein [Gemmatimonadota bacterium]NNM06949.1 hypothetical protein [Gemmatimonadota bacterium]